MVGRAGHLILKAFASQSSTAATLVTCSCRSQSTIPRHIRRYDASIDVRLAPDTDSGERLHRSERLQHSVAAPKSVRLAAAVLARFAGTYDAGRGREFQVTLEGDQLFMKRPGYKVALPIVPVSETTFLQARALKFTS
jgi:hypothetical protein